MNTLIISGFVSYGDILYSTPLIHYIKHRMKSKELHVWSCNPEPLINNPDIDELWELDKKIPPIPHKFFDRVYQLRNDGPTVHGMSRFHTTDFFSLNTLGIILRKKDKGLIFKWSVQDRKKVEDLLKSYRVPLDNFVVVCPTTSWPSRTLPLEYYKEIIARIQKKGDRVVLVGKEIDPIAHFDSPHLVDSNTKGVYSANNFPGAVNLINRLSFHEMGALYSMAKIAINTENGNMVVSGTNGDCWNVYIASCTAPEFRIPFRDGSQRYKTVVVQNEDNWFPQDTTEKQGDLINAQVKLPSVDKIYEGYLKARRGWENGDTEVY